MNCTRKTAQRADAWNSVNRERERYTVPAVVQTTFGGCELRDKRRPKRLERERAAVVKVPPNEWFDQSGYTPGWSGMRCIGIRCES